MKVDNPRFEQCGEVCCAECPLDHQDQGLAHHEKTLCYEWYLDHLFACPTAETYTEACRLAEQANKGEK